MEIQLRSPLLALSREHVARVAVPAALAGTMLLGFALRGWRAFTSDLPLNDGGMFYTVIEDIRAAGGSLPHALSYNAAGIPFAYPPLAFYVALLTSDALALPTAEVLRVLPPVLSALTVLAFAPLARALSASVPAAVFAVFVMAVQPSAYAWMVMGGGLTRSLGMLLAICGLVAFHAWATRGGRVAFVAAAAFAALTILAHIEMAWFLAFSCAVLLAFRAPRPRDRARGALAIGAVAAIATAPWWGLVLARHGPGPFIAAATTGSLGNPFLDLLAFRRTDEPFFPIVAALGILGLVACVLRRRPFVPVWLVAIALLDARSFNALSALPLGLLAGIAATEVIAPLARDRRALTAVAIAGAAYAATSSAFANSDLHRSVTAEERAALAWVGAHTPPDARVLVVSQRFWAGDRLSEWLPALAGRRSVATVQGYEWFPRERGFWAQMVRYDQAQECGARDGDCLEAWVRSFGPFDHVLVPKSVGGYGSDGTPAWCCGALRTALRADGRYQLVYDGPGATIYARR